MRVQLASGEQGLTVDLPDDRTTVVEPRYVPGAQDPAAVLRSALREPVAGLPLREIVRPGQKVAISVCDGTRAQPRDLMVPAFDLVELRGFEPLTPCMPCRCATSCATAPFTPCGAREV